MNHSYILWATGEDKPGLVASVSESLYRISCNLEDSTMTRLGGEFGILLIFSSPKKLSPKTLGSLITSLRRKRGLNVDVKTISNKLTRFKPLKKTPYLVSVHGYDQPGIVYKVTSILGKNGFNITDLTTHRTSGKKPGYILLIEGELNKKNKLSKMKKSLSALQRNLKIKISFQPIHAQTI